MMAGDSNPTRRLSELARRVLHTADAAAHHFEHPGTTLGHVLVALLSQRYGQASTLLHESGLDARGLLGAVRSGEALPPMQVEPLLAAAAAWAGHTGSHFVGTEHLLLAIVSDGEGAALLRQHGADVAQLYARLTNPPA
jgi:ATP-dependent Clp protease ATP-binding subunit ClpC